MFFQVVAGISQARFYRFDRYITDAGNILQTKSFLLQRERFPLGKRKMFKQLVKVGFVVIHRRD